MREPQILKERPILFSGPMVRAIFEGRKTQTRRVVKPQPNAPENIYTRIGCDWFAPVVIRGGEQCPGDQVYGFWSEDEDWRSPYGAPGDRLWVRETFRELTSRDAYGCVQFRADNASRYVLCDYGGAGDPVGLGAACKAWDEDDPPCWKPSIFMPRWACRVELEILRVRVERLHDISEADVHAEGFENRKDMSELWDSLNAKPKSNGVAYPWDSDPWVWIYEFKVVELYGKETK